MLNKTLAITITILLFNVVTSPALVAPKEEREDQQTAGIKTDETILDDFEGADPLARWGFYNGSNDGPGFPGAKETHSLGEGYIGRGLRLGYDFSGGGKYVAANLNLNRLLPAIAVAFQIKSNGGVTTGLRVDDGTGQTLQYNLVRPLTAGDGTKWYRHVVRLDTPSEHWGGANDGIVHGGIRAVRVLAAKLEPASIGEISVDDVAAISGTLSISLDPALSSPPPAGSGDLLSKLGINCCRPSSRNDSQALDAARSAGFALVRMDLLWDQVEKIRGEYDFSAYNGVMAALATRGMKVLFILDYGNPLYSSGCYPPGQPGPIPCPPTTPDAILAFGKFAEAAAGRFAGRGVSYEIWNEPNLALFWPPAPNPAQYAALARTAIAGIRRGDPVAKVTTGGLAPIQNDRASFDYVFMRGFFNAGGAPEADAFGVHPYTHTESPELVADNMLLLRSRLGQWFSPFKPIWDTEWGYTSTDFGQGHSPAARAKQAVRVTRRLLSSWAMGFPLIVYYDLYDDGPDPNNREHNFGLLTNSYADKPAMTAVRTLTSVARNRGLTGVIKTGLSGLHALKLAGAGDTVIALWYSPPGGVVEARVPNAIRAINQMGQPVELQTINGEKSLTVRESGGPVYVTFGGTVVNASAASFSTESLAPESIAAAFGLRLATTAQVATTVPLPTTLAGTTVKFKDMVGNERSAPLFFVSPIQVNYQVPPGTAAGRATVTITSGDGTISTGTIQVNAVAPGLFAANGDGQGVPAGYAIRVKAGGSQAIEQIARLDTTLNPPRFVAIPLDLGPASDQVFLVLFGTGVRLRSSLSAVTVTIGGVSAPVLYAGPQQGLVGLDQVNLLAPRTLIGRGEVNVNLTVDGQPAKTMRINIK